MISDKKSVDEAKRFAKAYKPSEDDHPDLESRVVMFNRAVEAKDDRAVQAHARTLTQFVGLLGLEVPKPAAKKAASSGQRGGSGSQS